MKILYGYPFYPSANTYGSSEKVELDYLNRLNNAGYELEPFCLTIDPPNNFLTFTELNRSWKTGNKKLLSLYEKLEKALEGKDVFINAAGINLHPAFIEKLSIFTVFGCNDDPESSHILSRPAAYAYDLCLIGNIAEVETYRSWGIKNVEWVPLGLQPHIYDASLTYDKIVNGERDVDLFMMIDKLAPWRRERMEKIDRAFPNAHFYGRGWSRGYLSNKLQLDYLKRTKIGLNFHNSSGPINFRTYYLPANGAMQICDNKGHLGKIYELDKEVIGFDSVKECIEKCNYYLSHERERLEIAVNGWKRAITDYNEVSIFQKKVEFIKKYKKDKDKKYKNSTLILNYKSTHKYNFIFHRFFYVIFIPVKILIKIKHFIRGIWLKK